MAGTFGLRFPTEPLWAQSVCADGGSFSGNLVCSLASGLQNKLIGKTGIG